MQSIISQLDNAFRKAIRSAVGFDADPIVGVSQNEKFGDYQSNAAMGLAKLVSEKTGQKTNPRQIAEQIKAALDLGEMAQEITIAGPGFINVRLSPKWLANELEAIANDPRLGIPPTSNPQTVVIDYSGPNIAKQMHVGHLRSTIIGDAISRVIEFQGHRVIRQNHLGDWGTQFGMLIAYLKEQQSVGDPRIEDLDKFYKEARKRFDSDPAFADEARANVVRLQAGGAEERALWQRIVDESRRHFQPIYHRLAVKLDSSNDRGESFYNPLLPAVVADLKKSGSAVESEGATVVFTEGHEAPIIIEKSGGGYGYATTDLAAIRYRINELRADRVIYFVGNPQAQHFQQDFATAKKAHWTDDARLEFAGFGSVLGEDGKMFKARSGDSVKLGEVLDEAEERALKVVENKSPDLPAEQKRQIARAVGIGAVKYADLSKDRVGDYVFSWDKMLALDGNTGPYLQYAHARICSILRKASEAGYPPASLKLESAYELAIAKQVLRMGEVVDAVAKELKPHVLCGFLYELATRISGFFENCPVLQSDDPVRGSRIALCKLIAQTMALGLDMLGIDHPDRM
jgi:arginyl-tRNA synthetase